MYSSMDHKVVSPVLDYFPQRPPLAFIAISHFSRALTQHRQWGSRVAPPQKKKEDEEEEEGEEDMVVSPYDTPFSNLKDFIRSSIVPPSSEMRWGEGGKRKYHEEREGIKEEKEWMQWLQSDSGVSYDRGPGTRTGSVVCCVSDLQQRGSGSRITVSLLYRQAARHPELDQSLLLSAWWWGVSFPRYYYNGGVVLSEQQEQQEEEVVSEVRVVLYAAYSNLDYFTDSLSMLQEEHRRCIERIHYLPLSHEKWACHEWREVAAAAKEALPTQPIETLPPSPTSTNTFVFLTSQLPRLSRFIVGNSVPWGLPSGEMLGGLTALYLVDCHLTHLPLSAVRLPHLQYLNLSMNPSLDSEDLKALTGCHALETLILCSCERIPVCVGEFAALPRLRFLDFSFSFVSHKIIQQIGEINNHTLQELHLEGCVGVRDINPLARLTSLRRLTVSRCALTTEGTRAWSGHHTQLKVLHGVNGEEGVASVLLPPIIPSLEYLTVRGVSDGVLEAMGEAARHGAASPLSRFEVIRSRALTSLSALGHFRSLTRLLCEGTMVTEDGLLGLEEATELRWVTFKNCPELRGVRPLVGLPRLRVLQLRQCGVSTEGVRCLTQARGPIEWLALEECESLHHAGFLSALPSLQRLYLRGSPIEDDFVEHFTSLPTPLRALNVEGCELLRRVGRLGTLRYLERLDLSLTAVDDEGLEGLQGSPSLQYVRLIGCTKIQHAGVLLAIPTLRVLDADWCEIQGTTTTTTTTVEEESALTRPSVLPATPLSLYFRQCDHLQQLNPFHQLHRVRHLDLSNTAVTSDQLERAFTPCAPLQQLEYLALTLCRGITGIDMFVSCPSLRVVELSGSNVRHQSFPSLVWCLRLEVLLLQNCKAVYDVGVLGRCPSLETLDLSGSNIRATGLAGLERSRTLRRLLCRGCGNLTTVAPLGTVPSLEELIMSNVRGIDSSPSVWCLASLYVQSGRRRGRRNTARDGFEL